MLPTWFRGSGLRHEVDWWAKGSVFGRPLFGKRSRQGRSVELLSVWVVGFRFWAEVLRF